MISEEEIKHEFMVDLMCRTCLSVGRKLSPVGPNVNLIRKILPQCGYWNGSKMETVQVCWECQGLLSKMVEFQQRVVRATSLLQMEQDYLYGSLSSLTTVIFNDKSPNTVYVTETNQPTHTEAKPESKLNDVEENSGHMSDDFIDNTIDEDLVKIEVKTEVVQEKKSKSNKWARKRALLNKKPKFKLIQDCKEVIRKFKITEKEILLCLEKEKESEVYKASKYKCESCVLGYKDKSSLEAHVNKHHNQTLRLYVCDVCNSHISKKPQLIRHISEHFYKYECVLCPFSCYWRRHANMHRAKHKKVFQCIKCELKFGSRREFFAHYKAWHERFVCEHCGVSFKMRYCIKDHIKKQHSPFECQPCGKRFSRYNGLWLHNKVAHGSLGAGAYCVECDRRYPDHYRYRWHLRNSARHTPRAATRVPCPGCEKVFSKKIYMKDHFDLVHLKHFKYRCEQCDKNFVRNADLAQHRRRVHEGLRPPRDKVCSVCGRGFTTNKILSNHVRTHTGERPFACARCPAAFAQRAALAGHARAKHAPPAPLTGRSRDEPFRDVSAPLVQRDPRDRPATNQVSRSVRHGTPV